MKLISEHCDTGLEFIKEEAANGKTDMYISGIFMQAEKKNRNGRIYPRSVLEKAVNDYNERYIKTKRAVGELNHPEGPTINLDKVSHIITELKWDGNNVIGKAKILDTPMGQIARGLIEGGVQLGVSSRGMGSLKQKSGQSFVGEDFMLNTVDIVQDPSAHEAFVDGIMEGAEWVFDDTKDSWVRADSLNNIQEETIEFNEEAALAEFKKLLYKG